MSSPALSSSHSFWPPPTPQDCLICLRVSLTCVSWLHSNAWQCPKGPLTSHQCGIGGRCEHGHHGLHGHGSRVSGAPCPRQRASRGCGGYQRCGRGRLIPGSAIVPDDAKAQYHTSLVARRTTTAASVGSGKVGLGRGLLRSFTLANPRHRPVYSFCRGLWLSVGVEFRVIACTSRTIGQY